MGYASSVTGRAAHEALLARQDAELRLMETMKRCLLAKMKSDREYALALSAAAAQGQKMDKCEELNGSVIASAWRTMTEEWENTSRLIRANAEALESRALDRLTTLMTERRKARKTCQEDHSRISTQFTQGRAPCQLFLRCKYEQPGAARSARAPVRRARPYAGVYKIDVARNRSVAPVSALAISLISLTRCVRGGRLGWILNHVCGKFWPFLSALRSRLLLGKRHAPPATGKLGHLYARERAPFNDRLTTAGRARRWAGLL
ncbi:Tyrosine-protein kinase Fer [Eumeta japonica]|uniref:Tyrosine-protein kinase Fer n=1 Tax=Eumeta variegata TaxID=151549 RepID=A0A4C1TN74_EUMVA|nr:Tyrosine-protein kinase Fer [Eumeta japonica]